MEPEEEGEKKATFADWLTAMAAKAGADTPEKLQVLLLAQDCHCTIETLKKWLSGDADPSFDKTRDIIKALHNAMPDVEVWEEYKQFTLGNPFLETRAPKNSQIQESLNAMLKQSGGLPPPLE